MANDELIPFVLKNIKGLDSSAEKKGSGAYGTVYKVSVKGVTCIAKRLHDILVTNVSPRERVSIQRKFGAECVLLSKLRHPNVVHFVGVHYGRSANDLSLIMECLHTDLAKFLEGCSNEIPLSIKLSILLDVSYGLLYFHTHTPPIIHRDLSANNVLLTTDLRAKIADLGVAKLLDRQTQAVIAQTKAPGSQDYMPPEALQEIPVYNYKLDIFSFGHLTLFVAGQEYPVVHDLSARDMYSALRQSTVQIQRRRRAIEQIGVERHTLYPLITQCLQDEVNRRPTTTELNASLKELCTTYPHSVAEVTKVMAQADKTRENIEQEYKDREKAHSQVAEVEERYQHQLKSMVEQLDRTTQELEHTKKDLNETRKRLDRHKETLSVTETLLHSQLEKLSDRIIERDGEVAAIGAENEQLRQEVLAKTQQVKQYKKQVDHYKEEVGALKHQQNKQVEMFAREADEWKTKCNKVEAEARKERSKREAFERRIADLEILNDQLQQERNFTGQGDLLKAAQDKRMPLKQQTQDKDRIIQKLQGELEALRQQVSLEGQSQTAQNTFWEVSREEVSLNMQKIVGTGPWGFVVEGTFRGQQVAVKCLHDMIRSPKSAELMRKEIAIMAQIRHPNLVLLIAAVLDAENNPLIVTELLDISLRKAYEKNCLHGSSKLNIFRDIAAALNYLHLHHSGGIIHQDVSSSNVLLTAKPNNQWNAKLGDFGSADFAMESKTICPGAPVYAAPEVMRETGIPRTGKVDVYSYGILLCEVTVEQFPDKESLPSMIQAVQGKWAFMHHLITSCIQDHPDNRPTMSYLLGELNKLQSKRTFDLK